MENETVAKTLEGVEDQIATIESSDVLHFTVNDDVLGHVGLEIAKAYLRGCRHGVGIARRIVKGDLRDTTIYLPHEAPVGKKEIKLVVSKGRERIQ